MFSLHPPELRGSGGSQQQVLHLTRCRRGSSSPASPTLSSYSSSEGASILTGDADDFTSLMTASDGDFAAGYYDDDTMTSLPSEAETVTMGVSELASFLEADSLLLGDTEKMVLQLWADSAEDVATVDSLYKPLFDCVVNNKRQELYKVSQWPHGEHQPNSDGDVDTNALCMPSLSVVVFLREEPMTGEDAWLKMKEHFSGGAWKFHHSEAVSRGKLHAYENNSQDYLIARDNMPLCAMRQLHCGKRILRFLRFVSSENWKDNVNLYSLLLAKEPDVLKTDFCLYTASYHAEYDVQLALKKIPEGIQCEATQGAALCFRVSQVGHTVPLLPNICTPVTDDRWRTTDLDDNVIFLDVVRMRDRSCEPVPELTDCEISPHLTPTDQKKHSSSYPSTLKTSSAFQTVPKRREGSRDNYSDLKPDEKYDSQHYASNSESGIGSFNILEYDSLDELELLISDIASNCSEAVNFAEVNGGDYVKISDRDACGAVDGSSYHSEGNHEDQQQLSPLPVIKPKPPVPPKPSKLLHQIKQTDTLPQHDTKDDVNSSSSSSSKSELLAVNRPVDVPVRKGILVSSKEEPRHLSSPQQSKSGFKAYQRPSYWAGLSESPSRGPPSNSKSTSGSYKPHHDTAKEQEPRHQRNDSSPIPKPTTGRPALPSYNELQLRNKSQYQQYQQHHASLTPNKQGYNGHRSSCEDLLQEHGVYYEKIVPPKPNIRRTNDDYVPMHSPSSSSSGSHSGGKGLQVSSFPRHGAPRSADRPTAGNTSKSCSKPASNQPPPYRPPPAAASASAVSAASATMVVNRMPPSYTAATSNVKKQEQLSVRNQDSNKQQSPSERQRFRFDGATMPRFGRNSKLRQSVLPPPCFDRDFSDSYEEQAIDVPGAATAYSEKTRTAEVDSSTLGFYV